MANANFKWNLDIYGKLCKIFIYQKISYLDEND